MKTISGFILSNVLGWKIVGGFPQIKKSIVIFAPHTSYYDALYGKLCFNEFGMTHRFYPKRNFFISHEYFYEMVWVNSGAWRSRKNAVYQVARMLDEAETLHVILSAGRHF